MAVFLGIVLLFYRDEILGDLLTPLSRLTAQTVLALIHLAGLDAVRISNLILHPDGFVYDIHYRCTGFLPIAFLCVSILVYPGGLRTKTAGLAVGVPLLVLLNLIRLVHLFYIGIYNPAIFDFAHSVLWQGLMILAVFGLWIAWKKWVDRQGEVQSSRQEVQRG
jgi:exosortase/archaeosortase family protein